MSEVEHRLLVAVTASEPLQVFAHAHLDAQPREQLARPKGLAHVVVRPVRERTLDFGVGVEGREHDHGHFGELRTRAHEAEHRVAVRLRHDQVEQDGARRVMGPQVQHRVRPARNDVGLQTRSRQHLPEHVAAHTVVIDD